MSYNHHPHNFTLSPTELSAQSSPAKGGGPPSPSAATFPPLLQTLDTYVETASDTKASQEIQMLHQLQKKDGKPAAAKRKLQKKRGNAVSKSLMPTSSITSDQSTAIPSGSLDLNRIRYGGEQSMTSTITGDGDSLFRGDASVQPQPPRMLASKTGGNRASPVKRVLVDPLNRNAFDKGSQKIMSSEKTDLGFGKAVESLAALKLHNYAMRQRDHISHKVKLMKEIRTLERENNYEILSEQKMKQKEMLAAWKIRFYVEYLRFNSMRHIVDIVENQSKELSEHLQRAEDICGAQQLTIDGLQREVDDLKPALASAKHIVDERTAIITTLEQKLHAAEALTREQKETIKRMKDDMSVEKNAMKRQQENADVVQNELRVTQLTCQELVRKLAASEGELQHTKIELEQSRQLIDCKQMQNDLMAARQREEKERRLMLEEDSNCKLLRMSVVYTQLSDREIEAEQIQQQLEHAGITATTVQKELDQTRAILNTKNAEIVEVVKEKNGLHQLLTDLAVKLSATEEQLREKEKELTDSLQQIQVNTSEIRSLKSTEIALTKVIEEKDHKIDAMKFSYDNVVRVMEMHNMRAEEMEMIIAGLVDGMNRNVQYSRHLEEELFTARKLYQRGSTEFMGDDSHFNGSSDLNDDVPGSRKLVGTIGGELYRYDAGKQTDPSVNGARVYHLDGISSVDPSIKRDSAEMSHNGIGKHAVELLKLKGVEGVGSSSVVGEFKLMQMVNTLEEKIKSVDTAADSLRVLAEKASAIERVQAYAAESLQNDPPGSRRRTRLGMGSRGLSSRGGARRELMSRNNAQRATTATVKEEIVSDEEQAEGLSTAAPGATDMEGNIEDGYFTFDIPSEQHKQHFITEHLAMEDLFNTIHAELEGVIVELESQQQRLTMLRGQRAQLKISSNLEGSSKEIRKRKKKKRKDDGNGELTDYKRFPSAQSFASEDSVNLAAEGIDISDKKEQLEQLQEEIKACKAIVNDMNTRAIAFQSDLFTLNNELEQSAQKFFELYNEPITKYYPSEENFEGDLCRSSSSNEEKHPRQGLHAQQPRHPSIAEDDENQEEDNSTSKKLPHSTIWVNNSSAEAVASSADNTFSLEATNAVSKVTRQKSGSSSKVSKQSKKDRGSADEMDSISTKKKKKKGSTSGKRRKRTSSEDSATSSCGGSDTDCIDTSIPFSDNLAEGQDAQVAPLAQPVIAHGDSSTDVLTSADRQSSMNDSVRKKKKKKRGSSSSNKYSDSRRKRTSSEDSATSSCGGSDTEVVDTSIPFSDNLTVGRDGTQAAPLEQPVSADGDSSTDALTSADLQSSMNDLLPQQTTGSVKSWSSTHRGLRSTMYKERSKSSQVSQQLRGRVASLKGEMEKLMSELVGVMEDKQILETARDEVKQEIVRWHEDFYDLCGYPAEVIDKNRSSTYQGLVEAFIEAQEELKRKHVDVVRVVGNANQIRDSLIQAQVDLDSCIDASGPSSSEKIGDSETKRQILTPNTKHKENIARIRRSYPIENVEELLIEDPHLISVDLSHRRVTTTASNHPQDTRRSEVELPDSSSTNNIDESDTVQTIAQALQKAKEAVALDNSGKPTTSSLRFKDAVAADDQEDAAVLPTETDAAMDSKERIVPTYADYDPTRIKQDANQFMNNVFENFDMLASAMHSTDSAKRVSKHLQHKVAVKTGALPSDAEFIASADSQDGFSEVGNSPHANTAPSIDTNGDEAVPSSMIPFLNQPSSARSIHSNVFTEFDSVPSSPFTPPGTSSTSSLNKKQGKKRGAARWEEAMGHAQFDGKEELLAEYDELHVEISKMKREFTKIHNKKPRRDDYRSLPSSVQQMLHRKRELKHMFRRHCLHVPEADDEDESEGSSASAMTSPRHT